MTSYSLRQTDATDIQTTFRFSIDILGSTDTRLGLTEDVTGYIQRCDLPVAPGSPIVWHLPGGMQNHQAGKRTVQPVTLEFVVPTNAGNGSIYTLLENWSHATYDLNTGTNIGKKSYCTDAIYINCRGERGFGETEDIKYRFHLLRAQPTNCSYGTLSSESNNLLSVSCTFIYDNYEVLGPNGTNIRKA